MIEVFYATNEIKNYNSIEEITYDPDKIFSIRFIDFDSADIDKIATKFDLDLTSFSKTEDIEISSHFIEHKDQLSFHFTIPSFSDKTIFEEHDIYILIKDTITFTFLSKEIANSLNQLTQYIYVIENSRFDTFHALFMFQIGVISDYYADIVEIVSKKIKELFHATLQANQFKSLDLDTITAMKYNNLLINESVSEFKRILMLLKKSDKNTKDTFMKLNVEIEDLSVIEDYLAYNFNRLDDLSSNINSKIDLEQNHIFKLLTIITVCISLPTLIAGVYGMNFKHIPELEWQYGYYIVLVALVLSFVGPLLYFKIKKWF
jgi:magnesium transporter